MHRPPSSALSLPNQRSRRPVTQLLSRLRQTPTGTLRPRAPREQCPVLPISQGPANLRKKGPLVSRFSNVSDMDIDSISDERKWRSRNIRSLERPLPLSQSQPQSPARSRSRTRPLPPPQSPARSRSRTRPLPPPHSPTHHIPPLIPPTADRDPIPVNSPPPPPARYPTSPPSGGEAVCGQGSQRPAGSSQGGTPRQK